MEDEGPVINSRALLQLLTIFYCIMWTVQSIFTFMGN